MTSSSVGKMCTFLAGAACSDMMDDFVGRPWLYVTKALVPTIDHQPVMVTNSSTMVCRDGLPGTFSYCYLLLSYMNGNAAKFRGVILITERVVLL